MVLKISRCLQLLKDSFQWTLRLSLQQPISPSLTVKSPGKCPHQYFQTGAPTVLTNPGNSSLIIILGSGDQSINPSIHGTARPESTDDSIQHNETQEQIFYGLLRRRYLYVMRSYRNQPSFSFWMKYHKDVMPENAAAILSPGREPFWKVYHPRGQNGDVKRYQVTGVRWSLSQTPS